MIDPLNITNFSRNKAELEAFLIFAICVAGKKSKEVAPKVVNFINSLVDQDDRQINPFEGIYLLFCSDLLEDSIREHRLGKYNDLIKAFWDISIMLNNRLNKCNLNELQSCHGIGPKTARFFLLHSRPNQKYVVLDTHILKWVREEIRSDAPKATPTSDKTYREWEDIVIRHLRNKGVTNFAEFDLNKWKHYAR